MFFVPRRLQLPWAPMSSSPPLQPEGASSSKLVEPKNAGTLRKFTSEEDGQGSPYPQKQGRPGRRPRPSTPFKLRRRKTYMRLILEDVLYLTDKTRRRSSKRFQCSLDRKSCFMWVLTLSIIPDVSTRFAIWVESNWHLAYDHDLWAFCPHGRTLDKILGDDNSTFDKVRSLPDFGNLLNLNRCRTKDITHYINQSTSLFHCLLSRCKS